MRFESIHAGAFGGLFDQDLRLAPGMNIIHGPNEAAKSTWHAAMSSALCGQRRARGQLRREEREFTARHRPWDRTDWSVGCVVQLDSGRRIELRHDLVGGVDCRATDLALGRDISNEIMHESTPDGARYLGLDRESFVAIACVRQADILAVVQSAQDLQEHLQRAATSQRADTTAAVALERLDAFQRERVGSERANSSRPLRSATVRLSCARNAVAEANDAHRKYDERADQASELATQASHAQRRVRILVAAVASVRARVARQRSERVNELAAPQPAEPPSRVDDDRLARQVAAAITTYEQRSEIPPPPRITSAELRAQLGGLPAFPEGDLSLDPTVERARRSYDDAQRDLGLHHNTRPADPIDPVTGGLESSELRTLAAELDRPTASVDPTMRQKVEAAGTSLETVSARRSSARTRLIVAAAVFVIGVVAALVATPLLAVIAIMGLAVAIHAGVALTTMRPEGVSAELEQARGALGAQQRMVDEDARRRQAVTERLRVAGLPTDADRLRALADAISVAQQQRDALAHWQQRARDLEGLVAQAHDALAEALERRHVTVAGTVEEAVDQYARACGDRARDALGAARRTDLENQLSACLSLEQSIADATEDRRAAEAAVREAAVACAIASEGAIEAVLTELDRWQHARTDAIAGHEAARRSWTQLQTLLAGQTVAEVESERSRTETQAVQLSAGLDPAEVTACAAASDLDEQLSRARRESDEVTATERRGAGALESIASRLPSVAEADEALAAATTELERVKRLNETLTTTIGFLTRAQDAVHRDIAQILAKPVRERLSAITRGRYTDVVVDPETLSVQVRTPTGKLRNAALLSHGTAEQIYLLLRVAMAEHLTNGESCPLLLDDVTAQTDPERTPCVLELLHCLSESHQVVLFSQEADVAAWAKGRLTGARDSFIELDPALVAP
jgi:hypothetical protein